MVFTANPEDYTARGKIITPLKDRIGSEIRTHYPATLEQGVAITQQEAWTDRERASCACRATSARWWRAWPSPRAATRRSTSAAASASACPSRALENAVSNAERRALLRKRDAGGAARLRHLRRRCPSLTGKFELEYEGELMGAENVARELIREAVGEVFSVYLGAADLRPVVALLRGGRQPQAARRRCRRPSCCAQLQRGARPAASASRSSARAKRRPGAGVGRRGRVRARGPVRPEEDRPQRRPRLRGARAPGGDGASTSSASSGCGG